MVETVYCVHCGAVAKHPVVKIINGQSLSFCCGGCVQVYELLHEEELLSGQGMVKVTNMPTSATQPGELISFHVGGMTCANCVATVARHLRAVPGVIDVNVILETEQATVKMIPAQVSMDGLKRAVEKAGYEMLPEGGN